jgi:lysophospholipase L1-like esterase
VVSNRSRSLIGAALLLFALASDDCSKAATATSPSPPPTAVAPAPSITCGDTITATASGEDGARVNYPLPENHGGEGAVTVTCTPVSGELFPVGSTPVECKITDSLSRSASCSFAITVASAPKMRLTRFLAFGDSLTAGEQVVPGTEDLETRANPDAAYPAVLARLLQARYASQTFTVVNRGKPAEQAARALGRFADELLMNSPEAAIILEGVNDIIVADTGALGIDAAERGVSELAAHARNRHIKVYLVTLPPTKAGRRRVPISLITGFNDRLRVIARGEGAVLIDIFTPLSQDIDAMVGSDGLHLTEAGYKRVAETIFAALEDDLEIK